MLALEAFGDFRLSRVVVDVFNIVVCSCAGWSQSWVYACTGVDVHMVCVQAGVNSSQVKATLGSFHLLFLGRVYH